MMKTEKDKVKKKVWIKPGMIILSVKYTNGGPNLSPGYENIDYRSS